MRSCNLNRLAKLEQTSLPSCVVFAIPRGDGTWSISGCWGRYGGTVDAEGLAKLEQDKNITNLVIFEVYQEPK